MSAPTFACTLTPLAPGLWHKQHAFAIMGMGASSRMTVARLADGSLWLHSPVPLDEADLQYLADLGPVHHVVAPSKMHHLFAADCMRQFPQATLHGVPGLAQKCPHLPPMQLLDPASPPAWTSEIALLPINGIPAAQEYVFLHQPSQTLILTDLCQWHTLATSWSSRLFARAMGVQHQLGVSRIPRMLVKDKAALAASLRQMLQWPFQRVVVAHDVVLEHNARQAVQQAFANAGWLPVDA